MSKPNKTKPPEQLQPRACIVIDTCSFQRLMVSAQTQNEPIKLIEGLLAFVELGAVTVKVAEFATLEMGYVRQNGKSLLRHLRADPLLRRNPLNADRRAGNGLGRLLERLAKTEGFDIVRASRGDESRHAILTKIAEAVDRRLEDPIKPGDPSDRRYKDPDYRRHVVHTLCNAIDRSRDLGEQAALGIIPRLRLGKDIPIFFASDDMGAHEMFVKSGCGVRGLITEDLVACLQQVGAYKRLGVVGDVMQLPSMNRQAPSNKKRVRSRQLASNDVNREALLRRLSGILPEYQEDVAPSDARAGKGDSKVYLPMVAGELRV